MALEEDKNSCGGSGVGGLGGRNSVDRIFKMIVLVSHILA